MSLLTGVLKSGGLAFSAALVATMITIFAVTRDIETIPYGFLTALYVLPAIITYVVLSHFASSRLLRHTGFLLVTVIIFACFSYFFLQASSAIVSDGSEQMILLTIYCVIVGSLASYLCLTLVKFTD